MKSISSVVVAMLVLGTVMAQLESEMKIEGGKYNFAYSTGDEGGHKREETSNGDGSVSGTYSYLDPNGNLRSVEYKAGPGIGFQASGDIGVDKKTAEEAEKVAALAPKAPEPIDLKVPIPASPFTYAAPLYAHPALHHLSHAAAPLAYNLPHPLAYNTLPLIGHPFYF